MPKRFTEASASQLKGTLARRFVPLADSLRDMLTKFGLRPYVVRVVRIQWSGGRRGVGVPSVVSSESLLPTPKVMGLDGLTEFIQPVGMDEIGGIEVTRISGRYTEEQLRGFDPATGDGIPKDTEFFYEVEYPQPGGAPPVKRRFYPSAAPTYYPGKLQWTVRLEKAHEDRSRNGDPE